MITFDFDQDTGCISILTQTEAGNHREALCPGDFDRAGKLLPPEQLTELQALWTDALVARWEQKKLQDL